MTMGKPPPEGAAGNENLAGSLLPPLAAVLKVNAKASGTAAASFISPADDGTGASGAAPAPDPVVQVQSQHWRHTSLPSMCFTLKTANEPV